MSFKILLLSEDVDPSWPQKIRAAVPGVEVKSFARPQDAVEDLADADAIYGTLPPELFSHAKKLRWIAAARAGLGGAWFYDALVKSPVVVTNMRGSYDDHLAAHIVAFVLAFARRFDGYLPLREWRRGPEMLNLQDMTLLLVGVGGAGAVAGKLCAALGLTVIGSDPRILEAPEGLAKLIRPDQLEEHLGQADFVAVTVPETPDTVGMFDENLFGRMKKGAYFINIARGAIVVTDALIAALERGHLAGAGLDVVDPEPLPADSPLWRMPNVLITPHIAVAGAPYREKWEEILLQNCRRFASGQPLLNVVDKANWY